jgi:hypothetical protein
LPGQDRIKGDDFIEIVGRGVRTAADFEHLADRGGQTWHFVNKNTDFIQLCLSFAHQDDAIWREGAYAETGMIGL